MAAYAALVSLMHTIEQIERHPCPPISLDETQVQSLTEKNTFLQEFLEGYSYNGYSNEADKLEMRIADAAYAAEDVIDSHIVDQIHAESAMHIADAAYLTEDVIKSDITDQIHAGSTRNCFNFFRGLRKAKSHEKKINSIDLPNMDRIESPLVDKIHAGSTSQEKAISSNDLYEGLQKAIQDLDLIMKEATESKEKTGVQDLILRKSTPASVVRSSSTGQNIMVGFDDLLNEVMDKLTDGQSSSQIIPIVGMGGSGKTTLAKNVYQNQVVVQRFDILFWVTISQQYRVTDILSELVSNEGGENDSLTDECELGVRLHKRLSGRRYLIVLDDIWDIKVWDQLNLYFPDNNNGSRIMLTSRLSNLAYEVANSNIIRMAFLDEGNSWDLFCKIVFGEEGCVFELEEIGKEIVQNCKGLPLAIVVVGGLVAKAEHNRECWKLIGRNMSSVVNSEDDESCLKILRMSYAQLPVYLKPCFLYMGVFREDKRICVSTLIRLWADEGFVKPIRGKSLEIVAKEYLNDLIDRNLILVHRLGSTGSVKFCKIHDLLRDLCLREAQREGFYTVTRQHSLPECINRKRRIVAFDNTSKKEVIASNTLLRSLILDSHEKVVPLDFRLLRILKSNEKYSEGRSEYLWENMLKFVNLRYIAISVHRDFKLASSLYHLWNLQTLIVGSRTSLIIPSEIWKMPQLKQIKCTSGLYLPYPPNGCNAETVLPNLQKLTTLHDFKCEEETVRRIPNIGKLKLRYFSDTYDEYCLNNLERLHKLESFDCGFCSWVEDSLPRLSFPHSLKKLTLELNPTQNWEDIIEKIGSLPLLEKFRLIGGSFHGEKWGTVEGQFCCLKFLMISDCRKLKYWITDYTHFPRLERLFLYSLMSLKEIPSEIGDISSLQSIEMMWCCDSSIISAKEISREQDELGNEGLQIKVSLDLDRNEALMSLESTPNFQVEI